MMNKEFYEDILFQSNIPKIIKDLFIPQVTDKIKNLPGKRIIITGNGDSYIAGACMALLSKTYHHDNIVALAVGDATYLEEYSENDVLITLSMSGNSKTLVQATKKVKERGGKTISLSHNKKSPLAIQSDIFLWIPTISNNRMTPHSSDYLTSLLTLALLVSKLTNHQYVDINRIELYLEENLSTIENIIGSYNSQFTQIKRFIICASDINYPTALYGASKFWEARGTYAIATQLDEFGHGLHMTVTSEDLIIILPSEIFPKERLSRIITGLENMNLSYINITNNEVCNNGYPLAYPLYRKRTISIHSSYFPSIFSLSIRSI